jgi:hypothetical protein
MAGLSSGDAGMAVAVIGAGIMGSAMTSNLVAAGLNARVWNRSASATAPLTDAGAVVGAGPAADPCVGSRRCGRHRPAGTRQPQRVGDPR